MAKDSKLEGGEHASPPSPERKVSSRALEKFRLHIESVRRAQPGDGKKLTQCYQAQFIEDEEIVKRCAEKSGSRTAIEGLTEPIDPKGIYFEELLADPQVVILMAPHPDGHEKVPLGLLAMRFPQPGEDGAKKFRESLVGKFRKMGMSSLLGGERHFLHTLFMDDLYSASHFSVFEIASKDKLVTSALIYRTVQEAERASEEWGRKFASLSCHCLQGVVIDEETYNLAGNPPVNQLNWKNWMDVIFEIGADRQLHIPNALLQRILPRYYEASASGKKKIAVPSRLIFGVWHGTVEAIAKRVSLLGEVEPITDDATPHRIPQWREGRRQLVLGILATVCTGIGLTLWKLLSSDIPDEEAIPEQDATGSIPKQGAPERAILRLPRVEIDLEDERNPYSRLKKIVITDPETGRTREIHRWDGKEALTEHQSYFVPVTAETNDDGGKAGKEGYIVPLFQNRSEQSIIRRGTHLIATLRDADQRPLFVLWTGSGEPIVRRDPDDFCRLIAQHDLTELLRAPFNTPETRKRMEPHVRWRSGEMQRLTLDFYVERIEENRYALGFIKLIRDLKLLP